MERRQHRRPRRRRAADPPSASGQVHRAAGGNGGAARGGRLRAHRCRRQTGIVGRNADRVRALAKACDAEPLSMEQVRARHFERAGPRHSRGYVSEGGRVRLPGCDPGRRGFDMVYNPLETLFSNAHGRRARRWSRGCQCCLEQAVHQFEIWTESPHPGPSWNAPASRRCLIARTVGTRNDCQAIAKGIECTGIGAAPARSGSRAAARSQREAFELRRKQSEALARREVPMSNRAGFHLQALDPPWRTSTRTSYLFTPLSN
jgi:hypothetical protein